MKLKNLQENKKLNSTKEGHSMDSVIKFFEKTFTSNISKDAYLKACKWAAKYIIDKAEIGEVLYSVDKVHEADLPTFKIVLYARFNDHDYKESVCKRCQEFHSLFYINQQFNCNRCNLTAYRTQLQQKLEMKKQYRKERLRYLIEKDIQD
jgi:hypothetical protein